MPFLAQELLNYASLNLDSSLTQQPYQGTEKETHLKAPG
jgi:hypothetical protein